MVALASILAKQASPAQSRYNKVNESYKNNLINIITLHTTTTITTTLTTTTTKTTTTTTTIIIITIVLVNFSYLRFAIINQTLQDKRADERPHSECELAVSEHLPSEFRRYNFRGIQIEHLDRVIRHDSRTVL